MLSTLPKPISEAVTEVRYPTKLWSPHENAKSQLELLSVITE